MSRRIIGLAGLAGSGKDTVAQYISDWCSGFARQNRKVVLAAPIKDAALSMFGAFGITHDHVYGPSELRSAQIGNLVRDDGEPLTVRYVLQTLGTDCGRALWGSNIWVDIAMRKAHAADVWVSVVTDCRFNNEFQALSDDPAGELWHVVRPGAGLSGAAGAHASELDLDGPVLLDLRTHVIDNSGTLDDLRAAVARALHG